MGTVQPVPSPLRLLELIRQTTGAGFEVGEDVPFLRCGGTSLGAAHLMALIRDEFGVTLPLRVIMADGSASALVRALTESDTPRDSVRLDATLALDMPVNPPTSGADRVVVTGVTGVLGRHIVAALVRSGNPVSVLTRPRGSLDASERVAAALNSVGVVEAEHDVQVHEWDAGAPRLGLSRTAWRSLSGMTSTIIHAAADTNALMSQQQLMPINVAATRSLVELAGLSGAHMQYVSSVVAAELWGRPTEGRDLVSLGTTHVLVSPETSGYAQSKWISEAIVAQAAALGVSVGVSRAARLVAASDGWYGQRDALFELCEACLTLGAVPAVQFVDAWTEVDRAAAAVVAAALGQRSMMSMIAYAAVKHDQLWQEMRVRGARLRPWPLREWVALIEAAGRWPGALELGGRWLAGRGLSLREDPPQADGVGIPGGLLAARMAERVLATLKVAGDD